MAIAPFLVCTPILFKCGELFICFRVTPNTYHKINEINLTLSFYINRTFEVGGQKTYFIMLEYLLLFVIAIIAGILQTILFFKIWRACNNIERLAKKYAPKEPKTDSVKYPPLKREF